MTSAVSAHRQHVQELLLDLIDPVRREPGCLCFHLLAHADDSNAFVLVDEAVAAHPTHPGVLALVRPLLADQWKILLTQWVSENPAQRCHPAARAREADGDAGRWLLWLLSVGTLIGLIIIEGQ